MLTEENIEFGSDAPLAFNGIYGGTSAIPINTTFTLMEATKDLSGNFINIDTTQNVLHHGIAFYYDVKTEQTAGTASDPDTLTAKIVSVLLSQKQGNAPAEAQAASAALLDQAGDLVAGAGTQSAKNATENTT